MNPILIGLLGMTLAFAGGTWYGTGLGEDKEYAKRAREDVIVTKVQDTATQAAADAISKIRVRNTTIRQEVEREIQTDTRYITDCRHPVGVYQRVNEALTGEPRKESAVDGKLPAVDAPVK